MNKQEALTRVKTGNFNGDYGFDMQLLVDAVGIIGEMFRSGQISEVVRCKDCKYHEDEELGMVYCPNIVGGWVSDDFFCKDGERDELER